LVYIHFYACTIFILRGRRDRWWVFFWLGVHRRRMVVEYPTTYAIIAYHHESCEFESCSLRGVLDTTLCNKVCQ